MEILEDKFEKESKIRESRQKTYDDLEHIDSKYVSNDREKEGAFQRENASKAWFEVKTPGGN